MLLLYPIGVPCFFFYLLYRNRSILHTNATALTYGFLYKAFNADVWWFELVQFNPLVYWFINHAFTGYLCGFTK
jgi:hypothetical protein